MKRILIVHTRYLIDGGENTVFKLEKELLEKNHIVETLEYKNRSGISGALLFLFSIWNVISAKMLKNKILGFKPDVIHLHNWHFAAGPLIIRVAKKMRIPIVCTLHNFRLICPSAILLSKGQIFTDSINAPFPWKAIKEKVYRNSSLQTFWLSFIVWFHRKIGTWEIPSYYIVLTEFARNIFLSSKLNSPAEKFIIKPNFSYKLSESKGKSRHNYFLFIGRLSQEKGMDILINAFKENGNELYIIGDGPLNDWLMAEIKTCSNIKYLGRKDAVQIANYLSEAQGLILPSICYEGMPMTIIEAFSAGTPVFTSNIGGMASMVQTGFNGFQFKVREPESLNTKLKEWAQLSEERKESIRENALETFFEKYSAASNLKMIENIYEQAIHNYEKKSDKY